MKLWIVYFESANYCGYGEYCVVRADDSTNAEIIAESYAEDNYCEEDSDQWYDENGHDPDRWAEIKKVELFDEGHECWQYYIDPSQSSFYPVIN